MSAVFTVLEAMPSCDGDRRPLLAKRRGPAPGQHQHYDSAKEFLIHRVKVDDTVDLFDFLQTLAPHPYHALVRAAPVAGLDLTKAHRRLLDRQGDGALPTLVRGGTCGWGGLDLDRSAPPAGIDWRTDPRGAAAAIAARDLPPWVTDADYVAYYSGSQGFSQYMKLRVFTLLDRPICSADLLALVRDYPVDPALCRDHQLHYTATPLFLGEEKDPLPEGRHYLIRGNTRLARVPAIPAASRSVASRPYYGGASLGGLEATIQSMGDGEGRAGFHMPWNRALALFYAKHGFNADPRALLIRLAARIKHGGRDEKYFRAELLGMIKRARALAAKERARRGRSNK